MIILFDLDGTIIKSHPGIFNGFKYTFDKLGIELECDNLYEFIGPPVEETLQTRFNLSVEEALNGVKIFRQYYNEKGKFENELYNGIDKVIEMCSKYARIGLATSKPKIHSDEILKEYKLYDYFEYTAGANEKFNDKTNVIKDALSHIEPKDNEEIFIVGDRYTDIIGAKNVGIKSIGVLYGYGDIEELETHGADYIVKETKDLYNLLEELCLATNN